MFRLETHNYTRQSFSYLRSLKSQIKRKKNELNFSDFWEFYEKFDALMKKQQDLYDLRKNKIIMTNVVLANVTYVKSINDQCYYGKRVAKVLN